MVEEKIMEIKGFLDTHSPGESVEHKCDVCNKPADRRLVIRYIQFGRFIARLLNKFTRIPEAYYFCRECAEMQELTGSAEWKKIESKGEPA